MKIYTVNEYGSNNDHYGYYHGEPIELISGNFNQLNNSEKWVWFQVEIPKTPMSAYILLKHLNKFNEYFPIPKNHCCDCISYDEVKFFVTAKSEEFSQKLKYWLEINKEINLVNLRSND